MTESDAWQSFLERLFQGTLTEEDRVRLRRVLLISGQGNVLQVGKYNINIGQGENIQIGDRVYQGPDLETLRRVVREVQADIAADRHAASLQAYFAALREYCRNLPYLTLYDIRPPKKLDEVYVPLQLRERRPEHEPGSKGDETQRFPASTPDTLSIAEVLQQARKPHLLILGEPGAGKSTLLRRLAEQAWDNPQAIGLERPHLPMLIPLRTFASKSGSLEKRLATALGDRDTSFPLGEELPEGFFRVWAQQMDAPWLLLLDGLDEVPEDRRTGLMQWLDGILPLVGEGRVIITARPSVYNSKEWEYKPFSAYNIQPFTPEQARALAEKWFGDEAFAFLHALENVRAAALSGTPLLLTIAAKVYLRRKEETGIGSLPERRSQLYEEFINTWLKEAEARGLRAELGDDVADVAKPALARLALAMTEHPDWTDEERLARVAAEYLGEALGLKRDLAEARGRRFVQVMGRRSSIFVRRGETYDWIHPTFREYLAAEAIVRECRQNLDCVWERAVSLWKDENWREVALFVLGALSNAGESVTALVGRIWKSDDEGLRFAALVLAEQMNIEKATGSQIIDALLDEARKWSLLAALWEDWNPLTVLGKLCRYPQVAEGLLVLAQDEQADEWACECAVEALGELRDYSNLLKLVQDEGVRVAVRERAAEVLGKLGRVNEAAKALLTLARDERVRVEVRERAAEALGGLGHANEAVEALLMLVHDERVKAVARANSAETLGKLGHMEEATAILLTLARDEREYVFARERAVDALCTLGRPDDLLVLAWDNQVKIQVRARAAEALGRLGCIEEATAILRAVAWDERVDWWVSMHAIDGLGRLGRGGDLLMLAHDKQVRVNLRIRAVRALGQLRRSNDLWTLAQDEETDGWVRVCAAEELGKLGRAEEASEVLLALTQNEEMDESVRKYAALLPDLRRVARESRDKDTRQRAEWAIEKIRERMAQSESERSEE